MISKKTLFFILFSIFVFNPFFAQEAEVSETEPVTEDEVQEVEIIEVSEKLNPVLPGRDPKLIFVEGEDAVSTNFNREPILNYSSSGFRTLQLNQTSDLHGEATYNSDYVFYVEEDGVYELWYGGTPPGNRDEVLTSYASPFRFVIDGLYAEDVYREDVNVVSEYAPSYYWNYVNDVTLAAGEHRIKFEVIQRRSLDNRYYFYFDNFFLVRKINGQRVSIDNPPDIFPGDMDDRSIDIPFKSFEEYEVLIRDNPEVVGNYIELAKTYSLAGDNINALKFLRRAAFLSPDEPEIMLLIAKNLIWRGSVVDGLDMYKDLLEIVPERIDLWTEAGKIAAWTGLYFDSIEFFEEGLKNRPDDLSLLANLGITNLWLGDVNQAESIFAEVEKMTGDDLDMNRELADIFRINGYAEKAVPIYRNMINLYPEQLQLYFDLEEAYNENDQRDKVQGIRDITEKTFISDSDYIKVTGTFYESQSMKEKVIEDYEEQLLGDPENLNLRRVLAEIYFWNGYRKQAIAEYRNILTNYTYLNLLQTENKMMPFLELLDRSYVLSRYIGNVPQYLNETQKQMADLLKTYKKTRSDYEALKKKNDDAEAKGETVDRANEGTAKDQVFQLEEQLATIIYLAEAFLGQFDSLSSQFDDESANLQGLMDDEKSSAEAFDLLMEGVDWKWDRSDMMAELNQVKKDGVVLANFVLGKILMFEGDPAGAASNFEPLVQSENVLATGPFALYQSQIWLGNNDRRLELYDQFSNEIDDSNDYIYYLNDYLDFIYLEEENVFSYLTGDPEESIGAIVSSFKDIADRASEINRTVGENIDTIHEVLVSNLERGFYNLASETYLLRNQLGDFYYNEQMYAEGIAQYKQVLAIDPWNLSAKFKLAQVYHFNGNWAQALKIYGEIYEEDSQFNNVASFYNELTREFADSFNFSARSFSDSSKFTFELFADYNLNFTPSIGMAVDYNVNLERYYRTPATSLLLHNLTLKAPISLGALKVIPEGGLYLESELIDDEYASAEIPGFGLFDYSKPRFHFGGDLSMNFDSVGFLGGYRYDWLSESFHGGSGVSYHQAKAEVAVNFIKTKVPFIEDTTIFISGNGKFLSDNNLQWFASAVVGNKIQLLREPAMYLNVGLDFSIEDATKTSAVYWTPDMSILTGLNLEYEAEFTPAPSVVIGERVWFNTDFSFSGTGGSQVMGLAFEAGNSLFYSKRDFTAFFNVMGTFTTQLDPAVSGIGYWSLTLELGVSALLPELLMP